MVRQSASDREMERLIEKIIDDVPENFPEGLTTQEMHELVLYKEKRERARTRRKDFRKQLILPTVILLISLISFAIPVATDMYESWKANNTIQEMMGIGQDLSNDPERLFFLEQARRYNLERQAGRSVKFDGDDDVLGYDEQLCWRDYPAMGWLQISKINFKFPIYHYSREEELINGVGHMENTSLPVGGDGTHCGLSGHSGMTDKRMFDDIRKLEIGDTFVVWTLDEPYAYRIYNIEMVLPYETDSMRMVPGRDLCTLITCAPYGINSHRLLVHGERCEYEPDKMNDVPVGAYINSRTVPLALGIAISVIVIAALLIVKAVNRREATARRENEFDKLVRIVEQHLEKQM